MKRFLIFFCTLIAFRSWVAALLLTGGSLMAVDFQRDIQPILVRYCYKCHGPDENKREGKLRLDQREGAYAEHKGVRAVVPGNPLESELIALIFSDDPDEIMPPPDTKNPLDASQKALLKQWIIEGADYPTHWSFVAPRQEPLPKVKDVPWPRNAIDHFILARLEQEKLRPAPEADQHTLVRRLYLDLIGLPPTPKEVDAYLEDVRSDPDAAYGRLVDRLLASPHYGERWARRWLDLARYADTNGYEKDRPRSIWPWRDWVINALNADMAFDQFTVEQLAGDMLPDATLQQRVATGFHRNTMVNEEGGIDPLEYRFYAMIDRVNTTGSTWLGLTFNCAWCHGHKYDPFEQKEYYRFMAFLNNADELEIEVPQKAQTDQRVRLEKEIDRLTAALPGKFPLPKGVKPGEGKPAGALQRARFEEKFTEWFKAEAAKAVAWRVLKPVKLSANLPRLRMLADGSILAEGDQTKHDYYRLEFAPDQEGITALRLEALPHESLPKDGPGRAYYEGPKGDFYLSEIALSADGRSVAFAGATENYAKQWIGKGKSGATQTFDGDLQTGWSTSGREGQAHQAIYRLAQPLNNPGKLILRLDFSRHYSAGLGRFRISVTSHAEPAPISSIPAKLQPLLIEPLDKLDQPARDKLRAHYASVAPELAAARKPMEALRKKLPAQPRTLIFQERPADYPRPTARHHRGEYLQAREVVASATPASLHSFPKGQPRNRLTFARWLVAPANPLVVRVTVNHQWAGFFGRGIVRTTGDFGMTGELPTHPALLDWLAVEFVRQGWSLKKLHRLIVTSATYRQSSRAQPALRARDPENKLLARGPRIRLEAELIRDAALRTSGLLAPRIGGPSVYPPQPAGITSEGVYGRVNWKVSPGADRYRRGLYTFSKRTAPFAMFATFDAPSGETCVARREVSNTPLQALTLLNDVVYIEAAQALGRMMTERKGSLDDRLTYLFRRCLTRSPEANELKLLSQYFREQQQRFRKGDLEAGKLAGGGKGDAAKRAAWTVLARSLLNLDEFITKN